MAIITISRQEGSISSEIASEIAADFKYPYYDKTIIEKALEENYGIGREIFSRYDEKKPSLFESYFHEYDRYHNYLKLHLFNAAVENKGCVILGRGAAFMFRDIPGVFRIRLIASEDTRKERIAAIHKCDLKKAEKIIHHSDHDRNGFHKFFYGNSWDESSSYDIVMNTDKLTDKAVSEIITSAVKTFIRITDVANSKTALNTLYLAQKIKNKVLYTDNIPVNLFEVKVSDRTAIISGTVEVESRIKECENSIMSMEEIAGVNNNLMFIQHNTW